MSKQPDESRKPLSSFGRRKGRRLLPYKQGLVDTLLPSISVDPENPMSGFAQGQKLHLEIGFGAGEHLAARAEQWPQDGFIGCEPFINGVAKLLVRIDEQKIGNIRLFTDDARSLIARLPDGCISQIYILFPDPWPKLRHHKRRLISLPFLASLARIQPQGGHLLLATDHVDYSRWMLEHIEASPHYEWTAKQASDWKTPPQGWVQTKYQMKTTKAGREPIFIDCIKKA